MRSRRGLKIVFALNSYGLGHATRSLPLIQAAVSAGYTVYVIAFGRSLAFLRRELGGGVTKYFELPDYSFSRVFSRKGFSSRKFFLISPLFIYEAQVEHKTFLRLNRQYRFDIVVSDSRFGIYLPDKPSYLLSNQLKHSIRKLPFFAALFTERYMHRVKKNFTKVIVPDTEQNPLSGKLTHNFWFFKPADIEYIGILSMLKHRKIRPDIDYFISISGPEPQRTVFEQKITASLDQLQGKKVVVTLGNPEKAGLREKRGALEIYGLLDRKKQEEIMNRARLVVTRSGYSTVMDLAELEKKALYIPTAGQPEQEYLARYHKKLGHNYAVRLKKLNLARDLAIAERYPGYKTSHKTADSVQKFLALLKKNV
ncbi:MAG: hypothetical protein LBD99_04855 [Candidatus Margulisbacteria bacterium]|jgi:UDP:flavonoid glycosyltransferase YjiC (YdhE family)|nr:hypothetical protein [Candidatus Margulisiibacteriota bacterium]